MLTSPSARMTQHEANVHIHMRSCSSVCAVMLCSKAPSSTWATLNWEQSWAFHARFTMTDQSAYVILLISEEQ